MAATLKIPTIFTAQDRMTSVIKRMTKSVATFSKKSIAHIRRFDQKITKSFKKLGSFAQAGIGLGAGFIARGAIDIVRNYEQAVADLSAVMNTTAANQQLLAKDSQRLGAITAKSATEVTGLQEAFARLGFTTPQILNMTEATISGSIAMNAELAATAELTGAMVKTFEEFSSIDTPAILDKMTLATQKSALNFEKLQTSLPIVAGAANAANIPFEESLALLGKLSDSGIDASSSATALRNVFLESAKRGVPYTKLLDKISGSTDKLATANDLFGKRGAVAAVILAKNIKGVKELQKTLSNEATGAASKAAETRLNTFSGALTLLSSAYEGLLLNSDKNSGSLKILTSLVQFITKHINKLALGVGILVGAFVAMKVVVGIMRAIEIATKLWTGAQWLLNIAMDANPIGLIIIAIAALVGIVALAISKYDEWGATLLSFLGPLGWIINLIQSFRRNWDMIKESFSSGGILEGLKSIGKVILDSILGPMEQFIGLLAKIPGMGKLFTPGLEMITGLRQKLGVEMNLGDKDESVQDSPEVASNKIVTENIQRNNVDININDKAGNVSSVEGDAGAGASINLTTTQQF